MNADPSITPDEPTFDERLDRAEAVVKGKYGYVYEDGSPNPEPIIDKLLALTVAAEAHKKAERANVCINRRRAMRELYPDVVGPEGWADTDDPELSQALYERLDGQLWRMTSMAPSGPIQSRLNSDHGLVLLRTHVNPGKLAAWYSSRALDCILEDAVKPARAEQTKRANRDAALFALFIERVPEHGKRFNRELLGGLQTALESAKAISAGALETSVADDDEQDVNGDSE